MKCSYNLGDFKFNAKVKDEFEADLIISQSKIEIEFNLEEVGIVLGNALEMRKLFIEGVERITPVIKEAVIDLGKTLSTEAEKWETNCNDRRMNIILAERESEKLRHENRMTEFQAEYNKKD